MFMYKEYLIGNVICFFVVVTDFVVNQTLISTYYNENIIKKLSNKVTFL